MKSVIVSWLAVFSISGFASTTAEVLQKPLIIGASISSEYTGVVSPGRRLAKLFTTDDLIRKFAYPGQAGVQVLGAASWDTFADRSLVIGVDLMFWDSGIASPTASIGALWTLISKLSRASIPIVIADVPSLSPSMQPGLELLNQEIHAACAAYPKCILLPLERMFLEAMDRGYIEHRGQRYSMEDFLPDGLHVSDTGSEYLADRILELLEATYGTTGRVTSPVTRI